MIFLPWLGHVAARQTGPNHQTSSPAIALPAWQRVQHRASANAVVVSLSDENLQRWTQLYRLQALD